MINYLQKKIILTVNYVINVLLVLIVIIVINVNAVIIVKIFLINIIV